MDRGFAGCQGCLRLRLWAAALALSAPVLAHAFDDLDTHPRITRPAVRASKLDATLKNELDITDGINAMLRTPSSVRPQPALEWQRIGSRLEDDPGCRASNHFHDPLRPFTSSGVSDLPSWIRARGAYFAALTLREPAAREAALAETFQALGQIMHLVQDLAVPAHVRNDFMSQLS